MTNIILQKFSDRISIHYKGWHTGEQLVLRQKIEHIIGDALMIESIGQWTGGGTNHVNIEMDSSFYVHPDYTDVAEKLIHKVLLSFFPDYKPSAAVI